MTNTITIAPKQDVQVQPQSSQKTSANNDTHNFADTLKNAKESEQKTENKPVESKESETHPEKAKDTTESKTTNSTDQDKDSEKKQTPDNQGQIATILVAESAPVVVKTETVIPASTDKTQMNNQVTTTAAASQNQSAMALLTAAADSIKTDDKSQQVNTTTSITGKTFPQMEAKQATGKISTTDALSTKSEAQSADKNISAANAQANVQETVNAVQTQTTTETTTTKADVKSTTDTSQAVQNLQVDASTVQTVQSTDQPKQDRSFSSHKKDADTKADSKSVNKESNNTVDSLLSLTELNANTAKVKQSVEITMKSAVETEEAKPELVTTIPIKISTLDTPVVNSAAVTSDTVIDTTATTTPVEKTERTISSQSAEIPKRIIDQVVREVSLTKTSDRNDLVVKLTPPSLGTLRLQVTQDASGMTTQIVASSQQVKDLLNQHMPTLITAMNDAGIKMDSLTITTDNKFESGTFADSKSFSQAPGQFNGSKRQNQSQQQYGTGTPILTASGLVQTNESAAFTWYA